MLVKGDLQQLVLSEDLERLVGLEGCLSGNVPGSALAHEGGVERAVRPARARRTRSRSCSGPGTFINEAANQIDEQLASQTKQAEAQAKQAERVVTQGRAAPRAERRRSAHARPAGEQDHDRRASRRASSTLALQYGLTSRPSIDDHDFVSSLVFDSSKPRGHAQAALRLPVPEPRTRRSCRCACAPG